MHAAGLIELILLHLASPMKRALKFFQVKHLHFGGKLNTTCLLREMCCQSTVTHNTTTNRYMQGSCIFKFLLPLL